jgi:hypothetical protein
MFINFEALEAAVADFGRAKPFHHAVVDGFFLPKVAADLEKEFPSFDYPIWHQYNNAIEIKKVCNNWNVFPPLTYAVFSYLNSPEFVEKISALLKIDELYSDPGLNGGGWHIHKQGGKLNAHLDYSLHPKLGQQRKLNIIIYLNSAWRPGWGGQLGMWEHDAEAMQPGKLVKTIEPLFNRAVLFDTTQNSWHGLPTPLTCPEGEARRSLAVYYLVPAPADIDRRGKALFAPTEEQANDKAVADLIAARASVANASSVYTSNGEETADS